MPTFTLGIFGQSFAKMLTEGPGLAALTNEFDRAGYDLNIVSHTADGSAAIQENAIPSTNYWWHYANNAAGPQMTSALAVIAAAPVKPTAFIWAQGQQDSYSTDPTSFPRFQYATYSRIFPTLKSACNPTYPNSVGIVTDIIGRRIIPGSVPGIQSVREAQIANIAAGYCVFGFDTFDLPLLGEDPLTTSEEDNSHPDTRGAALMGFRAAQRILYSLLKPYRMPPAIGTLSRNGNAVVVPIVPFGASFSHPSSPSHWAIRDATGVLQGGDLSFSWSGDTLTITPSRTLDSGARLLYPYGELSTLDRAGLIYDTVGNPLRSVSALIP